MRLVASTFAVLCAGGFGLACSGLSEADCDKARGEAFDVLNEAHTCDSDADCFASEWPGCSKPVSKKNLERIRPLAAKAKEGKCKEPAATCRPTPEVYCKQGLCVFREQGAAAP
jgi:hypothetical protein